MAIVRVTIDPNNPPELTVDERATLERHKALGDEDIDTSDIPELDAAFFERAEEKQLAVRLDRDVVEWFRSQGQGYQNRMNAVLRDFYERHRDRSKDGV